MHLGVLATASHAISTRTLFSVYYKPRLFAVLLYFAVILTVNSGGSSIYYNYGIGLCKILCVQLL